MGGLFFIFYFLFFVFSVGGAFEISGGQVPPSPPPSAPGYKLHLFQYTQSSKYLSTKCRTITKKNLILLT